MNRISEPGLSPRIPTFDRLRRVATSSWATSTGIAGLLLFSLCVVFNPRWESNDDIAMSMVAHGYGIVQKASPNLYFSNVVWGHIVRCLPNVNGVLGYSVATLASLLIAWAATLYFLRKLGTDVLVATVVSALVFARPALFPQFTLNAGLLTAAAVLALMVYADCRRLALVIAAATLAFLGFIIRSQEFVLVLGLSSPFIVAKRLYADKRCLVVGILLAAAIVGASAWDRLGYQGQDWRQYDALNASRAPYTDFGTDQKLLQRPDILKRYGYSKNDVELIGSFFFVDHQIADPSVLRNMRSELGADGLLTGGVRSGLDAIATLRQPELLPIVVAAAVLFLLAPTLPGASAWLIFLLALFATGMVGRGGLPHVDIPAVSTLLLMSVIQLYVVRRRVAIPRRLAGIMVSAGALGLSGYALYQETTEVSKVIAEQQAAIARFPDEVVVAWGTGMKFESIFPLLAHDTRARSIRVFPLGVFTYAPFSVGAFEEKHGRGFVTRVRSRDGILMVADDSHMDMLAIWCKERFGGELNKREVAQSTPYIRIDRVWCANR